MGIEFSIAFGEVTKSPFYSYVDGWWVGPFEFFQVLEKLASNATHTEPRTLYAFAIDGKLNNESYLSLEQAMAEAIAQRHVGRRGASATAVDTAAGWFCRMIGINTGH